MVVWYITPQKSGQIRAEELTASTTGYVLKGRVKEARRTGVCGGQRRLDLMAIDVLGEFVPREGLGRSGEFIALVANKNKRGRELFDEVKRVGAKVRIYGVIARGSGPITEIQRLMVAPERLRGGEYSLVYTYGNVY